MNGKLATVFGGTGFLGRAIVHSLLEAGWRVRVAARGPGSTDLPAPCEFHAADIRNETDVARAVEGARGAVNAVSLYVEGGGLTFEDIHVAGARRLASLAARAGIDRLVHISGIGADAGSPSPYVRARARGEEAVRSAFADATILRPSVLFGPGDAFLATLASLTRLPVIPLFGHGDTRLQPVFVEDVAAAARNSLELDEARGRTFELGGPEVLGYRRIIRLVLDHLDRRRPLLPVPFAAWRLMSTAAALLPGTPLTRDQVRLMELDNVVGTDALNFTDLGIAPRSLKDFLAESLPR